LQVPKIAKPQTLQQSELTKNWLITHAKAFREKYFPTHSSGTAEVQPEELTELLGHTQTLKELVSQYASSTNPATLETLGGSLAKSLQAIASHISRGISTYELLCSNLPQVLLNYFLFDASTDQFKRRRKAKLFFEAFSKPTNPSAAASSSAALSSSGSSTVETNLHVLLKELHNSLNKVENFEVFLHAIAGIGSTGLKYLTNPFKVKLERGKHEKTLRALENDSPILVDPLATISAVEEFLYSKISKPEEPSQAAAAVSSEKQTDDGDSEMSEDDNNAKKFSEVKANQDQPDEDVDDHMDEEEDLSSREIHGDEAPPDEDEGDDDPMGEVGVAVHNVELSSEGSTKFPWL